MNKHICTLCKRRGKTWDGSDPRCAFESGIFNSDNWNCATMNRLREIAEDDEYYFTSYFRDDMTVGSVGIIYCGNGFDPEIEGYTLIMQWYKNRGKTNNAFLLDENGRMLILTEEIASKIIESVDKMEECE